MTLVPERAIDEALAAKQASAREPSHFDTTDFSKFLQVSRRHSLCYISHGLLNGMT